jgi:hypothetical protein
MTYHDLSPEQKELAKKKGFSSMFASRDTLDEAYDYMNKIVATLNPTDALAVITAFQVIKNTEILVELEVQDEDLFNVIKNTEILVELEVQDEDLFE